MHEQRTTIEIKAPSQLLDFTRKVVLVTGGGSGIGAGIAKRFAQAGADVAICDLHPDEAVYEFISNLGRRALDFQADITDPDAVTFVFNEIASQWSPVDVLINNAGIYPSVDLLNMTLEEWEQTIDINLKAVFLCTQSAARGMVEAKKGGAIVNIGSVEALNPAWGHCHYTASKSGVVMFSNTAALELGSHGIRVNTVSPGLMNRPTLATDWPTGFSRYLNRVPLKRIGEPEDIADACLFLASDAARWITGAHLVVDGGIMTCPVF